MDNTKLKSISEWPVPKTLKDVQAFRGFCNSYRRFIKDFGAIARPLDDLTQKDTKWRWTDIEQNAFDTLKAQFTQYPVLCMYDQNYPTCIEVDASGFAT